MVTTVNTTWFVFTDKCQFLETWPMIPAAMILLGCTILLPYLIIQAFAPKNERLEDEDDHGAKVLSVSFCARQPETISIVMLGVATTCFLYNMCLANENLRWLVDVYLAVCFLIFCINPTSPPRYAWMATAHMSLATIVFFYGYILSILAITYEIGWDNLFALLLFIIESCAFVGLILGRMLKKNWTYAESHLERLYLFCFTFVIALIPRGVIVSS